MTLADLFDQHAKECLESAERMDDPVRRLLLLRMASEWQRDAAALRAAPLATAISFRSRYERGAPSIEISNRAAGAFPIVIGPNSFSASHSAIRA